ncbi:MAG: serine hydrolase [Saprospiraceae bacterium]|nr:serine hydrolase [Saprospiraceae bacterium]
MKKYTANSLLFSPGTSFIFFFFTLTALGSVSTGTLSGNPVSTPVRPSIADSSDLSSLPLGVPQEAVLPLEDLQDLELQHKLETILESDRRWVELSKNKSLSIGVVDMRDPMHSRFAAINGNHMMYAASLPKIAVLLASEDAISRGKIKETPEVKQDMRMMIAKSSNEAASRMIERIGIENIATVLQDPNYKFYDKQNGGGLWVGKPYGKGGTRIGDPLKNLSHAASVMQVCKYYYKLAFGQLVNEDRSRDMLQILIDPQLHHKFVSVLDRVAPNAKVYRKSGTWENWHADSALVWDENRRYIVVALAMDGSGEKILRDLMMKIDNALVQKG